MKNTGFFLYCDYINEGKIGDLKQNKTKQTKIKNQQRQRLADNRNVAALVRTETVRSNSSANASEQKKYHSEE